ncbi:MAG: DNA polymerase III subunit gamma/tau [Candidatus Omnitrophica bacterium]|jgi:DNA polymerase-3 subunit gamma/tau|nr:DNA polymerase III subunit gamma/tau [Candidatus Omnitrophota bacterium]MDD5661344.1 DNA polymerase III subunit gamma/tau [Candidatus Omnitrophota bacterium]
MSYTVFALKWRPQEFESIVGQDHIVGTLKNAISKNRLAHAYLFAGPRGVGKTSTARILAKSLNCKEGPTLKPCQKCPSCLEINQGRSLDVIEIDGASNRGIDEIRALRENVKFSPTNGKFKIYIIDEVHQITPDGFNALLKTLEEPPEFVKFIFATTHPQKVMPTIISRCQRMDFRRITTIEIISQLEKIIRQEKIAVDKEVLFAVAKSSDGSLRDAESVLDQLVSFAKGNVSLKDAISVLGMVEQEVLFSLADKIIHKDPAGALKLFNDIIDDGKDPVVFLVNLIEHFRNLMVAKVSKADAKLVDLPQEICDRLLEQSQMLSMEEIFTVFNILVATQEMTKRLDSQRIPLEISLVRLAHNKSEARFGSSTARQAHPSEKLETPSIPQAPKDKSNLPPKQEPEGKPAVAPIEKNVPPAQQIASITLESVKNVWDNIINNLAKIKMSVATYLSEGQPTKVAGNMVTVAFSKSCSLHKESLEAKDNKAIIEKAASELCNADLRVNFVLVADMQQNTEARSTPFIRSALDMFGGRVIKEE